MRLIDKLFGRRPATRSAVPAARRDGDVAVPEAAPAAAPAPAPQVAEPVEPADVVAEAQVARPAPHVEPPTQAAPPEPMEPEPAEPEPTAAAPTAPAVIDLRPAELRAWARENGIAVSDHGKIPRRVLDAYAAQRS